MVCNRTVAGIKVDPFMQISFVEMIFFNKIKFVVRQFMLKDPM